LRRSRRSNAACAALRDAFGPAAPSALAPVPGGASGALGQPATTIAFAMICLDALVTGMDDPEVVAAMALLQS
jgi:hypothetical protein